MAVEDRVKRKKKDSKEADSGGQPVGACSAVVSMKHLESYPSFVILRLKDVSREEREAVAAYALENLVGLPYRLEAGILDRVEAVLDGVRPVWEHLQPKLTICG